MYYLKIFLKNLKSRGFFYSTKKVFVFLSNKIFFYLATAKKKLNLLKKNSSTNVLFAKALDRKKYIVFHHLSGWNTLAKQRPQHIASELAKKGYLYLYPDSKIANSVDSIHKLRDNLIIVDNSKKYIENYTRKIIHVWSTNYLLNVPFLKKVLSKHEILYEFVDEIDIKITGSVPPRYLEAHDFLIRNESVKVVCTADKLYNESVVKRGSDKNIILAENGVCVNDFDSAVDYSKLPKELLRLIDKKEKIIGYYGALASWLDYELIKKIAVEKPNYKFVLIGMKYDNSCRDSGVESVDNIIIVPPQKYSSIVECGKVFDVSTIPFVCNSITESTSPVKLFEYMAAKKPIVTTDLAECRKYKTPLVSKNFSEFSRNIDKAFEIKDQPKYTESLYREALENDWSVKAQEIATLLEGTDE